MSSNIQSKILICDHYLFRNFAVGIWRREKPQHESAKVSEDQEESEAEEQDEEARKTDNVKIYCEIPPDYIQLYTVKTDDQRTNSHSVSWIHATSSCWYKLTRIHSRSTTGTQ